MPKDHFSAYLQREIVRVVEDRVTVHVCGLEEQLGRLVDTVENYLAFRDNRHMPDRMKVDAYQHGLGEIREQLKAMMAALRAARGESSVDG